MKVKKYLLFAFFAIAVIIIMLLFTPNKKIENLVENSTVNIGNYLSTYFYKYALSILDKSDFSYKLEDTIFVRNLPSSIPFDQGLYNIFIEKGFTKESVKNLHGGCAECMWHCENDELHAFWSILKPTIHSVMDKAFRDSGIFIRANIPIIHFRCADTPFVRNPHYHFQRYEFYKKALEKGESIMNKKYDSLNILYCNKHQAGEKEKKSCDIYLDSLKDYIEKIGYSVEVECGINIEDFAKMFYAPLVISNGSSFAFMSGFFGKGVFISTAHQSETNPEENCEACREWSIPDYNILHDEVEDYYDTDSIISMLWK